MTDLWNHDRITRLLIEAGGIARDHRKSLRKSFKPDASLVTAADCAIEDLISTELEDEASGVYLIGEETLGDKGEPYLEAALAGTTFVVDPIDGTVPYAYGLPYWGISIALMQDGRLRDGAIYLPDQPAPEIYVSDGARVRQACQYAGDWEWSELEPGIDTSAPLAISQDIARSGRVLEELAVHAVGSAVYELIGMLRGRYRSYVGSLKLWDVAGCIPLLDRMGVGTYHLEPGQLRPFGTTVSEEHFELSPDTERRWRLKGWLLAAQPDDAEAVRALVELP
jgi:myo-inositol-1(or 4)-monophosphatase